MNLHEMTVWKWGGRGGRRGTSISNKHMNRHIGSFLQNFACGLIKLIDAT